MDKRQLLTAVRALGLPAGEYAVFGSGPLVARGLGQTDRLEVVVTPRVYEQLREQGWTVHESPGRGESLRSDAAEARRQIAIPGYRRESGTLISWADRIDDVPFVALKELRGFAVATAGTPDAVDIDLIDQALANDRAGVSTPPVPVPQRTSPRTAAPRTRPSMPTTPPAPTWTGGGGAFLAGAFSRPGETFEAARNHTFWGTAYLIGLIGSVLQTVSQILREDQSTGWILFTPIAAAIGLAVAALMARVALGVARGAGGDGDVSAAASQTAIISVIWSLPQTLVSIAFGMGPLTYLVWVLSLGVYGHLAVLYSRAYGVSFGRGLGGAIAGTLALIGIIVGLVLVLYLFVSCAVPA